MVWVKRVVLGLAGLIILWAAIGLTLPASFRVERSIEITATPARVYGLIADPREWKRWTVWNQRDPAMTIEYAGAPAGKGAGWSWKSKSEGNGSMTFTHADENQRLVYRLEFPDFGMTSTGTLAIEPRGNLVRLSWSNHGDLGMNPLQRWFGLFMDRMVGPDFEAGLANLKRVAEKP